MIIVHDKLLEYGGAEFVLGELIKSLNPEFIFVPCITNRDEWQQTLNCKIVTIPLFSFVNTQRRYRLFYPFLAAFLLLYRVRLYSNAKILYYSSSLGKYVTFSNTNDILLYSNFPFKGVVNTDAYLNEASLLKRQMTLAAVPIMYLMEKMALKKFQKIAVISRFTQKAYLENFGISNTTIIHCPVNTSELSKLNRPTSSDFNKGLVICRLHDEKHVNELLDLLNGLSNTDITVIGDGPKLKEYRLSYPQVSFTGFLEEQEKLSKIASHHFLINPTSQEWSLTVVEANCAGMPAISAECEAISEINSSISGLSNSPNICYSPNQKSLKRALSQLKVFNEKQREQAIIEFSPRTFSNRIRSFINA